MSTDLHRARFVDYNPPAITAIAFSHRSSAKTLTKPQPSYLRCAIGRANGDIEIWNPRDGWCLDVVLKGGEGRTVEGLAWAVQSGHAPRLFSVGSSTQVTEWALDTLQPLKSVDCNAGAIWSLAISPDQESLAVGCEDGSLVMLDIAGGKGVLEYRHALTRQKSRILSLAFGNDDIIYGGCSDSTIKAWKYKQTRGPIVARMTVDRIAGEQTLVWAVIVLADGSIVSGDSTGAVKVWNSKFHSLQQNFKMHASDVLCLGASVRGDTFFSAGVDRRMQMYKLVDGKRRWAHISGRQYHQHDVRAMATYEADGTSLVVTGGVDMSLALIPLDKFMHVHHRSIAPVPHGRHVSVATAAEPRLLLSWSDRQIKIWSLRSIGNSRPAEGTEIEPQAQLVARMNLTNEENLTHAAIRNDGKYVAVCSHRETKLFALRPTADSDALRPRKVQTDALDFGSVEASFTTSGDLCLLKSSSDVAIYSVTETDGGRVEVSLKCELETGGRASKVSHKVHAYLENVRTVAVSPDEKHVAVCNHRNIIAVYDTKNRKRVSEMPALPSAVTALCWRASTDSSADRYLLVCTADMSLHEFDTRKGRLTEWSRTNTQRLPESLTSRKDCPCGVHVDHRQRCWTWGSTWIAYASLAHDLPEVIRGGIEQMHAANGGRKRRRSNLTNGDLPKLTNGHATAGVVGDEDSDDAMELDLPNGHAPGHDGTNGGGSTSLSVHRNGGTQVDDHHDDVTQGDGPRSFWLSAAYKPILHFGPLSDTELIVVERPMLDLLSEPHIPAPFYKKGYGRG